MGSTSLEHQGADFSDYLREDETYHRALTEAQSVLSQVGRVQTVDRGFLPNFVFGPDDSVVTLGQDGLVGNTLKYLNGQPVVGVNPDHRAVGWAVIAIPCQRPVEIDARSCVTETADSLSDDGQSGVEQRPDHVWRERPVHRTKNALLGPISHPQRRNERNAILERHHCLNKHGFHWVAEELAHRGSGHHPIGRIESGPTNDGRSLHGPSPEGQKQCQAPAQCEVGIRLGRELLVLHRA
jgi:hypothetical protein